MKKRKILILLLILPNLVFSNGGPVDISHFRKTGNIRLMNKQEVSLEKEALRIMLNGDYTEIDVEYKLKNIGVKQKIQYGFPVDAFETNWYYGDPYEVFSKENDCVQYFKAYENGEPLKVSQWIIDSVYNASTINLGEREYHKNGKKYQIVRKWSAITLEFEENEIKTIRIKYKIKNTLRDKLPGFKFINRYTDRNFSYDLTPSSNWGDGIVKEFSIELDIRNLLRTESEYLLEGIDGFETESGLYLVSEENYNLSDAKRINIRYNNNHKKMSDFIEMNEISKSGVNQITSSSENKQVENLIDNLTETAWNCRKGDWLEIEFNKKKIEDKSIKGILVLNGDYSNEVNFKKSGQLKKIRIILNDTIVFNTEPWDGDDGKKIINLTNGNYRKVEPNEMKGLAIILADGNDFYIEVDKIRIEVLETYGESAMLSELYFVGNL